MEHDIFQKIENAPKPNFENILSKSFDLFKLTWKECLFHGLISLAIAIPFILLIYAPLMPMYIEMIQASVNGGYYEPSLDFSVGMMVGYAFLILLFSIFMQVIGIGVASHFYQVLKKYDTGAPQNPGGYFVYLKGNFGKIFLLSLAMMGISLLALLLCYLPIFYVMVPLQLITPIFAFNKKRSVSDIIKASFKLGNRFWLIIFGLAIISSLIAQVGIIACFVGIFVTAYFVHIPMYYVYKDTIGFDDALQLEEI
ncbi:hypothetical protein ACFQO1_03145 [Jejudonia soesokkakensis]|uniref:Beta-carotene 15,15'-monooxygenase n=1 Tax=Jejudonia soesokkakensis TaxID=1323432 RepID=A0ABW2MSY5_9FLAO